MNPGISIGPLTIHYYGIIIMIGVLLAAWLSSKLAVRMGQNPDLVWDVLPWVLIIGIIGARIWHIFTPSSAQAAYGWTTEHYLTHPLDALSIWNGGLGIPGAVIGGLLALYLYCRKMKVNFATMADILAPGLALGQAVGRWGNFINQEVYGAPSNLPWAITIDPPYRLAAYQNVASYHPLFLYESIWNLLNMVLLIWMGKKYSKILKPGDIMLTYLIVYPVGRFLLEFVRLDPSPVAGLNINQALMGLTALGASIALFIRIKNRPLSESQDEDMDDEADEAEPVTETPRDQMDSL